MANVARFESASEIINTAAVEVGLTANTAPFSSPDPSFKQLIKLLTVCGRELALLHPWNMGVREGTFTVVAGQTEYDLPDDFLSLADSTAWNRNSNWPMYGSATPQTWTMWAIENPSLTFQCIFRMARRKFTIPADSIPAGTVIAYEYRSRSWALSGTEVNVYKDKVDDPGDIVLFESLLISRLLVAKFLRAKGFDSTGAFQEFKAVLDTITGKDKPAEILDLSGQKFGPRFIDEENAPDTGYGL